MRPNTRLITVAIFALSLLQKTAHADTFVYSVANHFASFQVDGTITTSNNSGVLSFADITDFDLLLSAGGQSEDLTLANAGNSGVLGDAFTATADGLFFDYGMDNSAIYFQNIDTGTFLCYQTAGCDTGLTDPHQSLAIAGAAPLTQAQAGNVQIASLQSSTSVTPEPSSLALLATGMVGAVCFARRRSLTL